jgi:hypothetical protein
MRIILILIILINIGCVTNKKHNIEKINANVDIIPPQKAVSDSCLKLFNLIHNNLSYEFSNSLGYSTHYADSSLRVLYFPWSLDSTTTIANLYCWKGLRVSKLIQIIGKPISHVANVPIDTINDNLTYALSLNRRTAQRISHNWVFKIENGIVVSSKVENKILNRID